MKVTLKSTVQDGHHDVRKHTQNTSDEITTALGRSCVPLGGFNTTVSLVHNRHSPPGHGSSTLLGCDEHALISSLTLVCNYIVTCKVELDRRVRHQDRLQGGSGGREGGSGGRDTN